MNKLQSILVFLSTFIFLLVPSQVLAQGPDGEDTEDACKVSSSQRVNMRIGPSTNFAVEETFPTGDSLVGDGQAIGSDNYTWWHLQNGLWVREDVVSTTGNCAELPTILFIDDFEHGTAKWRPWPQEDWQIHQDEENAFYCVTKEATQEYTYAAAVSLDSQDYLIQLDMMIEEMVDGAAGVQFRYNNDPLATYDYEADEGGLDLGRIWREPDGVTGQWLDGTKEYPYEFGRWHTVQILASGSNIEVYIDGDKFLAVSDDELEDAAMYHGTIRLYGAVKTESPDGVIRACFDNVRVTAIETAEE